MIELVLLSLLLSLVGLGVLMGALVFDRDIAEPPWSYALGSVFGCCLVLVMLAILVQLVSV